VNESTNAHVRDGRQAIMEALRGRSKQALFVTEIFASLRRLKFADDDAKRALAELEAEGIVMIRDHFCADPHLSGVDLRIAALVENAAGADPQAIAIRHIDTAWGKWLAGYLANHRCS
jgi:hypothetical protein